MWFSETYLAGHATEFHRYVSSRVADSDDHYPFVLVSFWNSVVMSVYNLALKVA
mgnify:CR=1 FL=1